MCLDRFDLNLLVALDVLLEEPNVTRSAECLHIGQSAGRERGGCVRGILRAVAFAGQRSIRSCRSPLPATGTACVRARLRRDRWTRCRNPHDARRPGACLSALHDH